MAETAVTILIEQLVPLMIEEAILLKGAKKDVAGLQQDLDMVRAFLKDADKRQLHDHTAQLWVQQVREKAYDIEVDIDEFLRRMRLPLGPGLAGFLRRITRFLPQLIARHQIAIKVREHQSEMKSINERGRDFSQLRGEESTSTRRGSQGHYRTSPLFVEESQVVGIDKHREDLVQRLLASPLHLKHNQICVISVTGMLISCTCNSYGF